MGVGEVLSVDSVTREDGGLYVCTADNGAGSKSRDFTVDVQCTFVSRYTLEVRHLRESISSDVVTSTQRVSKPVPFHLIV